MKNDLGRELGMTLAVVADLHLPDVSGSAQQAVLYWVVDTLKREQPDLVVAVGDLTACGALASARQFVAKLETTRLPLLIVPGNSDRRSPRTCAQTEAILNTPQVIETPDAIVVGIDSSCCVDTYALCKVCALIEATALIPQNDRERLSRVTTQGASRASRQRIVVVTHHDLDSLQADSRSWLTGVLASGQISLFVAGHRHRDKSCCIGSTPYHLVRGLDPDKAIGGPPALVFFDLSSNGWRRRELVWPQGTTISWADAERHEFVDYLGISCIGDPLAGIDFATRATLRCLELRANAASIPRELLRKRLATWRAVGGRYLSWHMPNLEWEGQTGRGANRQAWRESLALATSLGVQALTIHVPKIRVGLMTRGSTTWARFAETLAHELEPAFAAGLVVGIENMHMTDGETDNALRRFGYTPQECEEWLAEMRERLGKDVGFLLDVGHARNNYPFSKRTSLGHWYARMGKEIVAYHLHQVTLGSDGKMHNHRAIRSMYGPLISFASFVWGWKSGQLNHAPILLEIRDAEGLAPSLQIIRDFIIEG